MMKKVILLVTLCITFLATAQKSKNISIKWQDIKLELLGSTLEIPGFDLNNLDFQDNLGLFYTHQWDETAEINQASVKISNVVYEIISRKALKDLNTTFIPNKINCKVSSIQARTKKTGFIRFSPIIKDGNSFKRVKSLDIIYQTGTNADITKSLAKNFGLSKSILATGEWFKFKVDKTGVFKLTPEFLKSIGVPISSINPNTIKVYGNGGGMMPLLNIENTEIDLRENAVQIIGGEDGNLSGEDHILFYGEGTKGFSSENATNLNLYDDNSYYYITYGGAAGKRISAYVEPVGAANTQITSFTDYLFYEVDKTNIGILGRRWFGDRFDIENSRSYDFSFPNLITSEPIELQVKVAAVSDASSTMNVTLNGVALENSINLGRRGGSLKGAGSGIIKEVFSNSDKISVELLYNKRGNPAAIGYLDYISLKAKRALRGTGVQMPFYYEAAATSTGIGSYAISNAASISQIWDVTSPSAIAAINSNGASSVSFKAVLGEIRKYIAIVPSDYYPPIPIPNSRVDNQDIKGTVFLNAQGQFEDIDYLLITNEELLQPANRLAAYHRNINNYNVKVVTLKKIYEEFGGGQQDIVAIRNLVKYIYENASNPSEKLKFLCLFGDSSVDYKNRLTGNNNSVPTFQTIESFSEQSSRASDDFYGFMDPEEGTVATKDQLDIAVGRILADTPQLGNIMVNKIISYGEEKSLGRWRNSILLIADDVDLDWEYQIQENLNKLGDKLVAKKPFLNLEKIYADSYQQESSSSGNRYPKVNEAIINFMEKGAVVVNYFGHGGEDGLAKEFIFNKSNSKEVKNINKYPVFITVTCEYTKFDNPLRESAGELLYWNPEGGAVGLITTTRSIGVRSGINLNDTLSEFLFPEGSDYPSVAESLRLAKNALSTSERRVVFFIGDPAMKLAIPKPNIRLTKINDIPISQEIQPLKALGKIKISGEVTNESGTLLSNYNGILSTSIFDKEIERTTLANDGTVRNGEIIKLDYKTLGEIIFRGKASVKNGIFDFEFVVPKDISIPVGKGRISFYSEKNGALENQTGADENIIVGGLNENAPEDNIGPQIQLFMNDESFVSGGITDENPILIARLQDDNGINTASGIGHDIVAILDGDETNPIVLNDFYETEIDDFTKGIVNYNLKDIKPGLHTLSFKGWDVYNNSNTQEIQFIVAEKRGFNLSNVLNYPNPFVSYTEFWFEHSSSLDDILEVQVQVFTVSGKVIWTRNETLSGKISFTNEIQWDGRDDFGDALGKGVYVYKISVKSTLTNERVEKFEKLVIL